MKVDMNKRSTTNMNGLMIKMRIIRNLFKTILLTASGKAIQSFGRHVNFRQVVKWLNPARKRINIGCYICGYPRTGTHWIQNVIEKSTGLKTHKTPTNEALDDLEIPLVKIHARTPNVARLKVFLTYPPYRFSGKYIYTFRDPRDAIISFYEYTKNRLNLDLTPAEYIEQYDPVGHYIWEQKAWVLTKRAPEKYLLVRFENLKNDPEAEFRKIFDFLGLESEISMEAVHERVSVGDQQTNRPRAEAFGWKTAPEEYQPLTDEVERQLGDMILELGYELDRK